VYLIGGGAIALRGEKDSTLDLDIVLDSRRDSKDIESAFEGIGFSVAVRHPEECARLVDAAIFSKSTGPRVDIFAGKVCDML